MKEFVGETGGRFLYIDDINLIQELSTSLLSLYNEFGNFIFDGCVPSSGRLSSGYVILNGKLRKFDGSSVASFPCYIYEQNKKETVDYKNEQVKVGRIDYGCKLSTSKPSGIIDEITGKEVSWIEIQQEHRLNPTFKNVVIGKYAVMSSPSSNKQLVNGDIDFNGNLKTKGNLTAEQNFSVGTSSDKKMLVKADGNSWTMFLIDGTQRKPIITAYVDNSIVFFEGSDNEVVFKGGKMMSMQSGIGDLKFQGDSINGTKGALKLNSNAGRYTKTEVYDGANKIPVLTIEGNTNTIDTKRDLNVGGISVIDYNNNGSESGYLSKVSLQDKDKQESGSLSSNNKAVVLDAVKKDIDIIANDGNGKVNLKGKTYVNGQLITDAFVSKYDFDILDGQVITKDDEGRGLSKNDFTDEYKKQLDEIVTSTVESGGDGYVTAKDVKPYLDNTISKTGLLSDLEIDGIDEEKIVCRKIGAPHSSTVQGKLKNTGWLAMNHHSGGQMYNLHVKQFGDVVHIAGSINVDEKTSTDVLARLPNEIDPPKYPVTFNVPDISSTQGNSGVEVGILASSKELKQIRRRSYNNMTVNINLTYII